MEKQEGQKTRLCNIFVHPSHYNENLYLKLDDVFDCKFIFGDDINNVKAFDTSKLKNVTTCHVISLGKIQLQFQILPYAFCNYNYYLINLNTNNLTAFLFLIILKLFRKKKIYFWIHGLYGKESRKQIIIRKLFYGLADGAFLYGDYSKKLLIKNGFNPSRLYVIHNSLNYEEQLKLRGILKASDVYYKHFNNDRPVLVMIGRLNSRKKLDMLFDAMSLLNKKGSYYNAVIIGDGDYRERLEKKVNTLGLEKQVWFYGACYDEYKNAQLLFNADLCVVPGDIGLTAIHSMMFGVPVITHDYYPDQGPEFEVIEDGITGKFFNHDKVSSLADNILEWFALNQSRREIIRKECYKKIDKDWNPNYQIDLFKKVLDS